MHLLDNSSWINCIDHHFCLNRFVEVLNMKHVHCHLHNYTICTFHHFILLKLIGGGCLFLYTMILSKIIEYHFLTKDIDFMLQLRLYECLELLELLKEIPFGFQHI